MYYTKKHLVAVFRLIEWLIDWIENQSHFSFEWDSGNSTKNLWKHGITCEEAESIFRQVEDIRVLGEQVRPIVSEPRYGILGLTGSLVPVFVCFTIRDSKIRIIHVRKMNKKEKELYAKLCKK